MEPPKSRNRVDRLIFYVRAFQWNRIVCAVHWLFRLKRTSLKLTLVCSKDKQQCAFESRQCHCYELLHRWPAWTQNVSGTNFLASVARPHLSRYTSSILTEVDNLKTLHLHEFRRWSNGRLSSSWLLIYCPDCWVKREFAPCISQSLALMNSRPALSYSQCYILLCSRANLIMMLCCSGLWWSWA